MGTHILHRNVDRAVAAAAASRVFMFPGQSSVGPGILAKARRAHPAAETIAERTLGVLGDERAAAYLATDAATLRSNRDTQITVFVATQMYLAAMRAEGIDAACSLGLSLGEYSHLVHIGALGFEDALRLVDERGRCYDEAPAGIMATVLAVDRDTVASVVDRARAHGSIAISNINAPTQHVIAGEEAAIAFAIAALEDEHFAHVAIIERYVPMHSPMMAPVAAAFAPALRQAPWRNATLPYFPNVIGAAIEHPTREDFVTHLTRHVSEPVLWQQSVDRLVADCEDAVFIEVGPGGVLHNMMGRAWRGARRARVDAPDAIDPREHFSATLEALRA